MQELSDQLNKRLKEEKEYMESEIERGHNRMQNLEEMVNKERENRIESLDSQLRPIK